MNHKKFMIMLVVTVLALGFAVPTFAQEDTAAQPVALQDGPTELSLWYHGAGNDVEREILLGIIDDFNNSQDEYEVVLE